MVRHPLAGVIPPGHPTLARLWLSRQIQSRPFRHMSDLIAALHAVAPGVLDDPQFLDRSVLVDGVRPGTSARDLSASFALLDVEGAVVVRDSQTGFRVGLVVFSDVADCIAATRLAPRPGFYATCIPATTHGDTVSYILDALADEETRRPTAEMFRSLIPPQFLLDDETLEFHMRCVFVTAAAGKRTAGGAYGLCRVARDVLIARGYVCAVITWSDGGAGVLVYDDSDTTELLSRRAPRLLHQLGLEMQDSSLFPLPADPAARQAPLQLRLLPPYITEEHYKCRLLFLTGLDTQSSDAAEIAYTLQYRLDLIYEGHEIEAVIIHRSERVVVVVLRSSEDTQILLQEPPETWELAFGCQVALVSFGCPVAWPTSAQDGSVSDASKAQFISRRKWMNTKEFEKLKNWAVKDLLRLRDGETFLIARCLIELCALADTDVVLRGGFHDRSLLLSGMAPNCSDLWSRLSTFGILDDLVTDGWKRIGLAVFRSWHGAARLQREPPESWERLGFTDCTKVPGAEHAYIIAEGIRDLLIQQQDPSADPLP